MMQSLAGSDNKVKITETSSKLFYITRAPQLSNRINPTAWPTLEASNILCNRINRKTDDFAALQQLRKKDHCQHQRPDPLDSSLYVSNRGGDYVTLEIIQ